ncbi:hypothetical protein BKA80DRAFT_20654 [Phyllosticta citrichinensis]
MRLIRALDTSPFQPFHSHSELLPRGNGKCRHGHRLDCFFCLSFEAKFLTLSVAELARSVQPNEWSHPGDSHLVVVPQRCKAELDCWMERDCTTAACQGLNRYENHTLHVADTLVRAEQRSCQAPVPIQHMTPNSRAHIPRKDTAEQVGTQTASAGVRPTNTSPSAHIPQTPLSQSRTLRSL